MLYEGPGLARTLQHGGSCVHDSEDAMWILMLSQPESGSGWVAEKCPNAGLTACSPPPYEPIAHLSTSGSAGLPACIHLDIYRQFNVILTSTLLFSIKKKKKNSNARWVEGGGRKSTALLFKTGKLI